MNAKVNIVTLGWTLSIYKYMKDSHLPLEEASCEVLREGSHLSLSLSHTHTHTHTHTHATREILPDSPRYKPCPRLGKLPFLPLYPPPLTGLSI